MGHLNIEFKDFYSVLSILQRYLVLKSMFQIMQALVVFITTLNLLHGKDFRTDGKLKTCLVLGNE